MILLLVAALLARGDAFAQRPAPPSADEPRLLYVVSETVSIRAEPDAKSRAIARLKPFDVVSGRELVEGWLRIEAAGGGAESGWIPVAPDNMVAAPLETLKARIFRVQQTRWPERVKIDVIRGRIRHGFTADQVRLALGDPIRKELRGTPNDVAETWTYDDRRIVFSHTGVTAIEDLPIHGPSK